MRQFVTLAATAGILIVAYGCRAGPVVSTRTAGQSFLSTFNVSFHG